MYTYKQIHTTIYIYIYTSIYLSIYLSLSLSLYIYIYIYIHTHIGGGPASRAVRAPPTSAPTLILCSIYY